ncbi:RNA polymerase sigma factor [Paenibacillus silvae]|uniref:RNA polymerase sigma factor n=2 Tax=Paenibacillus silvae TaxID=1325358 RepID=A0ABQ1ZI60_9BACL|nr:RNA polymerase sigma factor [Paenibacillus silvae]
MYLLHSDFDSLDDSLQEWIYKEYSKLIYQDIYFMFQNHELAEDVVQDSFLKVITKAPYLKENSNIKAWLRTVARNTAYDLYKKGKKYCHFTQAKVVINIDTHGSVSDVANLVENHIRNELLYETLNGLNKKYRTFLILFYIQKKSYRDIADAQCISEQAVAQLLSRARKKLFYSFSKVWDK